MDWIIGFVTGLTTGLIGSAIVGFIYERRNTRQVRTLLDETREQIEARTGKKLDELGIELHYRPGLIGRVGHDAGGPYTHEQLVHAVHERAVETTNEHGWTDRTKLVGYFTGRGVSNQVVNSAIADLCESKKLRVDGDRLVVIG